MKQLISFTMIVVMLTSCTKKGSEMSPPNLVTFTYSCPKCERPQITFTGEKFGDVTTIADNSMVNLRKDQQYTVRFQLVAPRCSSGEIILSGTGSSEISFWLVSYPASAEKLHVNLETNYHVAVLGE